MSKMGGFLDKITGLFKKDQTEGNAKASSAPEAKQEVADSKTPIAKPPAAKPSPPAQDNKIQQTRNWFEERYETILVQRNMVVVLAALLLLLAIVAVASVTYIINIRQFDPFVIQIDDTTGLAKIVTPTGSEVISGDDAIAKYFMQRYIKARETYNPVDFETRARQTVRLLSSNNVYWAYRGFLRDETKNPSIIYGQKNTTYIDIKSWSEIAPKQFLVRFSITESGGAKRVFNKVAVIKYDFIAMELTDEEFEINPIGFQIIGYRVDEDNS